MKQLRTNRGLTYTIAPIVFAFLLLNAFSFSQNPSTKSQAKARSRAANTAVKEKQSTSKGDRQSADAEFHVVKTFKLGGDGGWDYVTVDPGSRRLYVSRATRVMVVDADSGNLIGQIADTPGVHGIALAPELGRGFTSNGRASTVTVFDLKTLKPIRQVKTGDNPDAIVYDPASKKVFVFNGRSKDATVIDAASGTVAATIPLEGRPEFAVADGKGSVYVNIEDKNVLAAIDSSTLSVKARWPLGSCEEPSGLAIDKTNRRLFSGCSNKLMAIVDADNGRVITTVPIGAGVDATAFDDDLKLAFSSNGDGTLTVVAEESPEKFRVTSNIVTRPRSKTMGFDPTRHTVFLPAARFEPPPAASAENPRPRPSVAPGSFEILVVSR